MTTTSTAALLPGNSGVDLEKINGLLEGASAEEVIRWAVERFGGNLVMTSSFGAHSAVMLHLMAKVAPGVPVILVDTGYLFRETYAFVETMRKRLSLDLRTYSADQTPAYQEAAYGKLWEQGAEGVKEYLRINKVEPLQRALGDLDAAAWLAGLRADQTSFRAGLERVTEQDGRWKVHPILNWSIHDMDEYLATHSLPHHPLYSQGYRSIGDVHSTLPTVEGQDPRDGRILGEDRECGIHLSTNENRSYTASKL